MRRSRLAEEAERGARRAEELEACEGPRALCAEEELRECEGWMARRAEEELRECEGLTTRGKFPKLLRPVLEEEGGEEGKMAWPQAGLPAAHKMRAGKPG